MDLIKSEVPIQKDNSVCHICNKWFKNLQSHISDIHDEQILSVKCNDCGKALKNRKTLKRHIMKYHIDSMKSVERKDAKYQCETCGKDFSDKESYNAHEGSLHKSEHSYRCDLCDKVFSMRSSLEAHIRYAHSKNLGSIKCTECNKSVSMHYYKNHLKLHEPKSFQCNICGKQFPREDNMLGHKKRIHDMERNEKCDQCDYSAFKKYELKKHQVKVHTVQERSFKCGHCEQDFTCANNLKRHKFNVHEKWKHHKCDHCEALFRSPGRLKEHIDAKHIPSTLKTKDIKCDICHKKFDKKDNLRTHKYFIHEEKDRHKCEICEKIFTRKNFFQSHIKVHLNKQIKVKCNICGAELANLMDYMEHIKSLHFKEREFLYKILSYHSKPKTAKCDVCEKEFGEIGDLKKHMKYVHNRIKNFTCDLCEKKFITSSTLKTHLKLIHKKGTLNISKCNICEKDFSMRAGLITHMNTIHLKIKKYQCNKCKTTFFTSFQLKKHVEKNPSCAETKT